MKLTIRQRVLSLLEKNRGILTATQIGKILNVRLDSLSSALNRMITDEYRVERIKYHGVREGYGYRIKPEHLPRRSTFDLMRGTTS